MKKKISVLLCILIMAFSFTGCSEGDSIKDSDKEILKAYTDVILQGFSSIESETFEYYKSLSDYILDYEIQVNTGLPVTGENFVGMINSWEAAVEECGKYKKHGEYEYERTNDGYVVSTEAKFADRKATISLSYDDEMQMQSLDVSAKFSMSEILTKAALNTLLGMGTVFVVLIFLAFLISLMKYIPLVLDWFTKKQKNDTSELKDDDEEDEYVEEDDDLELVAVITAAIAAQEGTSTDDFVVRSIRRRTSNNW